MKSILIKSKGDHNIFQAESSVVFYTTPIVAFDAKKYPDYVDVEMKWKNKVYKRKPISNITKF